MNVHHNCITAMRYAGWLVIAGLAVSVVINVPNGIAGEGDTQLVHLYFADAKRPFLIAESRVMVDPGDPTVFCRQLVLELINGSVRGNLATIPKGTRLRSFFLLDEGTAVVDFSNQLRENHPGSCRLEQLTLFSVVNSLILNVSQIDRVKILIDGNESLTLAGHIDLRSPLKANMLIVR